MAVTRRFLGWDKPFLCGLAEYLLPDADDEAAAHADGICDLRTLTIVLPGSRAGRRLLELLVGRAEERSLALLPPRIVTAGALPELLYTPRHAFASELQELLAWSEALGTADAQALDALGPLIAGRRSLAATTPYAERLRALWQELSSVPLDCDAVIRIGQQMEFPEEERWAALRAIHEKYLEALARRGLSCRAQERCAAIEEKRCSFNGTLILAGAADIRPFLVQMLKQLAALEVIVCAPEEHEKGFDQFGVLLPDYWTTTPLPLSDEQLLIADTPDGQAEQVVRWLACREEELRPEEIIIGAPDPEVAPFLLRRLQAAGVHGRSAAGTPAMQTPLLKLLLRLSRFAEERSFESFAALIRHTEFEALILRRLGEGPAADLLTNLDKFYGNHLQQDLTEGLLPEADIPALREAYSLLNELLAPFTAETCSEEQFSQAIFTLLRALYGEQAFNPRNAAQQRLVALFEHTGSMLEELARWETAIEATPRARLALLVRQLARLAIPEAADAEAIEILDWLELPLDDAPYCIVTGANEGFIPQTVLADPFLPNSLKTRLKIVDNDWRYARDRYLFQVLLGSRRACAVVCGRRTGSGDPLLPSRLLLGDDDATLARRLLAFHQHHSTPVSPSTRKAASPLVHLEPPADIRPPAAISASAFSDYEACPYRFYLRHVLRLDTLADDQQEMDGALFGQLAHAALAVLSEHSAEARSMDKEILRALLGRALDEQARQRFGTRPAAAVAVQIELLRVRLEAVADWHAERMQDGWQVYLTEQLLEPKEAALRGKNGALLGIRGRIDRVDYHPGRSEFAIIDYKTGTAPSVINKKSEIADLQLPAYWHLFRCHQESLGRPCGYPAELIFIQLPEEGEPEAKCVRWSEEDYQKSLRRLEEIADAVLSCRFWPPNQRYSGFDTFESLPLQRELFAAELTE